MTTANPFPLTGPDLVYVTDADPMGRETTSEAQNLAQDCLHWLICLPAGNLDNEDRGVGVETYLSGTTDDAMRLPSAIEADFEKDSRIAGCSASVLMQPDGTWLINVVVQPVAGAVFPLQFQYEQEGGLTLVNS